jgi:phosphatidylinositol alpha-1,6-mannosyltransferase
VLSASQFTAGEVVRFGGIRERCTVVLPAIDVERFTNAGAEQRDCFRRRYALEGKRIVLTVARLEARKGHDVALSAVAGLVSDFDDIHYVVLGAGDRSALSELAARLQMTDRLTVLDDVGNADLPAAYAAADLFVMVSRPDARGQVEGFGIVYLEAAAVGLPCVAGNLGGCTDAVVEDETGLCVDPTDVTAVAGAIRSILESPDRAKAFGERGRDRVLTAFQRSSFKARTAAVLEGSSAQ